MEKATNVHCFGGYGIILNALVADYLYQRHVTAQAEIHLLEWSGGKEQLFEKRFEFNGKQCRELCAKGVSRIERSGQQEWHYVKFRVWNTEGKCAWIMLLEENGQWSAQGKLDPASDAK